LILLAQTRRRAGTKDQNACLNAVLFYVSGQVGSNSSLQSGAHTLAATRRGPRRDKACACREATTAALDATKFFRQPEVLTEVEVIEAETELKALQRHALEVVDPDTGI